MQIHNLIIYFCTVLIRYWKNFQILLVNIDYHGRRCIMFFKRIVNSMIKNYSSITSSSFLYFCIEVFLQVSGHPVLERGSLLLTRSRWVKLTSTTNSWWYSNTIETTFKKQIYHWYLQRQRRPLLSCPGKKYVSWEITYRAILGIMFEPVCASSIFQMEGRLERVRALKLRS